VNLEEAALKAYEAIFSDMQTLRLSDREYSLKKTPRSKLRYFEAEGYTRAKRFQQDSALLVVA
jgi:hypothetical protein